MGSIENTDNGWSESVIMICNKCGMQFDDASSSEYPERMRLELKAKAKADMGAKVRVIATTCLNICPENKIAIVSVSIKDPKVFKSFAVTTDTSSDEIMDTIIKNNL